MYQHVRVIYSLPSAAAEDLPNNCLPGKCISDKVHPSSVHSADIDEHGRIPSQYYLPHFSPERGYRVSEVTVECIELQIHKQHGGC